MSSPAIDFDKSMLTREFPDGDACRRHDCMLSVERAFDRSLVLPRCTDAIGVVSFRQSMGIRNAVGDRPIIVCLDLVSAYFEVLG